MGFVEAIKHNFSHYADFSGRAQRSQYWWWFLFTTVVELILNFIDSALGWRVGASETDIMVGDQAVPIVNQGTGVLTLIFALAVLIPTLAVFVRRLHDTGRSAWWILWIALLNIVCFIGAIFWLVFMVMAGKPGSNKYGDNPLEQSA